MDHDTAIVNVQIDERTRLLTFVLEGGAFLTVPFSKFATLDKATPEQRAKWQIICEGQGVEWDALNEDLSLRSLLRPLGKD